MKGEVALVAVEEVAAAATAGVDVKLFLEELRVGLEGMTFPSGEFSSMISV